MKNFFVSYNRADRDWAEWIAWTLEEAFAQDPKGERRKLFPVRVRPCRPEGLLQSVIYVDLVGLPPEEAEKSLLQGIAERAKPAAKPPFPGEVSRGSFRLGGRVAPRPVPFPGQPARAGGRAVAIWREKLDFLQEQEAIVSDPAQRFALRKQIEEARAKIAELGGETDGRGPWRLRPGQSSLAAAGSRRRRSGKAVAKSLGLRVSRP